MSEGSNNDGKSVANPLADKFAQVIETKPEADGKIDKTSKDEPLKTDEDWKIWQSKHDKLQNEYNEYKTKAEKVYSDIEEFKRNPIEVLRKHVPDLVERLSYGGDTAAMLKGWQETELLNTLKEKFPHEVTDYWYFKPEEAYKAGTPSYYYRIATETKEREISSSTEKENTLRQKRADEYNNQVLADKKWLTEVYKYKDADIDNFIEEFDAVHEKIVKGELTADKHPLAIRNVLRGMFFDEFAKQAIESEVSKIHAQYKAQGMTLRGETPVDVSKLKDEASEPKPKEQKKVFSILENKMSNI